jgi:hypothetical protein
MSTLTLKERKAIEFREAGKSYREIGEIFFVSANHARVLCKRAIARKEWVEKPQVEKIQINPVFDLSARALNSLNAIGLIKPDSTRQDIKENVVRALNTFRLKPGKVRNYGLKSHAEVLRWLQGDDMERRIFYRRSESFARWMGD